MTKSTEQKNLKPVKKVAMHKIRKPGQRTLPWTRSIAFSTQILIILGIDGSSASDALNIEEEDIYDQAEITGKYSTRCVLKL